MSARDPGGCCCFREGRSGGCLNDNCLNDNLCGKGVQRGHVSWLLGSKEEKHREPSMVVRELMDERKWESIQVASPRMWFV